MTVNAAPPQIPDTRLHGVDALASKLAARYRGGDNAARQRDDKGRYAPSPSQEGAAAPATESAPVETTGEPEATESPAEAATPESSAQSPEPAERIPYERFERVTKENQRYREELETLRRELEAKREKEDAAQRDRLEKFLLSAEHRPKDWDDKTPEEQSAWIATQAVAEKFRAELGSDIIPAVRQWQAEKAVRKELKLDEEAAEVVAKVHLEHPKLPLAEALAIAKVRKPDLFQAPAAPATPKVQPTKLPASHRVSEPNSSPRNRAQPDIVKDARQIVADTFDPKSKLYGNKDARMQAFLMTKAAKKQSR